VGTRAGGGAADVGAPHVVAGWNAAVACRLSQRSVLSKLHSPVFNDTLAEPVACKREIVVGLNSQGECRIAHRS
jgi:hypothetical protein